MKSTQRSTLIMLVILTLAVGSVFVLAGFDLFRGEINPQVAKKLDLTDEQVSKLDDLKFDAQTKITKIEADLKIAQMELDKELKADAPDLDAVLKKVDEIGNLRTEIQKIRLTGMVKAKEILTPEQVEKWQTFRQQRWGQRGERMTQRQQGMMGGPQMMGQCPGCPMCPHGKQGTAGMKAPGMMMGRQGMGRGMGRGMGPAAGPGAGVGTGPGMQCPYSGGCPMMNQPPQPPEEPVVE